MKCASVICGFCWDFLPECALQSPTWVHACSCLTFCTPMDCSPPDPSVHGIFQAWILECVAISSSRGSSQLRDGTLCLLHWQVDSLPLYHLDLSKLSSMSFVFILYAFSRLPCNSNGKESACHAGDQGSIPGLGSSSGEGNGNLLQYSCLKNSMDREAWWAVVRGVAKSWTRLSD